MGMSVYLVLFFINGFPLHPQPRRQTLHARAAYHAHSNVSPNLKPIKPVVSIPPTPIRGLGKSMAISFMNRPCVISGLRGTVLFLETRSDAKAP